MTAHGWRDGLGMVGGRRAGSEAPAHTAGWWLGWIHRATPQTLAYVVAVSPSLWPRFGMNRDDYVSRHGQQEIEVLQAAAFCCGVMGTRVFVSVSTLIVRLCILVRPRSIRYYPYSSSQIMNCTVSKHLPAIASSALVLQPQYYEFARSCHPADCN